MKILLFGGSGFVGQHLARRLITDGYEVTIATRSRQHVAYGTPEIVDIQHLAQFLERQISPEMPYGIVNLAGESINSGRWTERRQNLILHSRLELTSALTQAIHTAAFKPSVLVNASAIGYYGSSPNQIFNEESRPGAGFLATVSQQWEAAALTAQADTRVVLARLGMVLGRQGGALPRMLLPYQWFVGGRLGTGQQWMSWVHIDDVTQALQTCITHEQIVGPINVVSPHPVTMNELGITLATVMNRPHWLPVPAWVLRGVLGEMSEIVLEGQRVLPSKLMQIGYPFHYPALQGALQALLHPSV